MRRTLIIVGILLVVAGLLWPWLVKIPLGRLPGDIVVDRPNIKVFIPITSMVVVSLVVSIILWLFRR